MSLRIVRSQKSASDPQRFHRRGYSALTEERTRKKLEGTLRECEWRLQHLADDFLAKHDGQAFVLSATGETLADYIQHRKEDYTRAKEREREAAKVSETIIIFAWEGLFECRRRPPRRKLAPTRWCAHVQQPYNQCRAVTNITPTARKVNVPRHSAYLH